MAMAQVREIADQKMGDMNAVDVEDAMQMVMGSARAIGLIPVNYCIGCF